jgi:hypothetical protein
MRIQRSEVTPSLCHDTIIDHQLIPVGPPLANDSASDQLLRHGQYFLVNVRELEPA